MKKSRLHWITTTFVLFVCTSAFAQTTGILNMAEQMPEYPGGTDSLLKVITSKVVYPKTCSDSNIQGKVYLRFVVNEDGSVSDVEAVKSPHTLLSASAIEAMKTVGKFKPGMQSGKPVKVWMSVPVSFKIAVAPAKEESKNELSEPANEKKIQEFIRKNLQYPQMELDNDIQGRVMVSFVITELGVVDAVLLVKGVSPGLDKEAIRVVKSLPKFKPALQDGKPVKVYFNNFYVDFDIAAYGFEGEKLVHLFDYYPGGFDAFIKTIQSNAIYPEYAKQKSIDAFIKIECIVAKNKKLQVVRVLNDIDSIFTNEAIRLINASLPLSDKVLNSTFMLSPRTISVPFILNKNHWVRAGGSFVDSDEATRLNTRGANYFKEGNYSKALEFFEAALKYYSLDDDAMYNRGATKLKLGDKAGACDDFKRAYFLGDFDALRAIKEACR